MINFQNGIDLKNREGINTGHEVKYFVTKEFHHYLLTKESIITVLAFKDENHFTENGINSYTGDPKSYSFREEIIHDENGNITVPEPKSYDEAELRLLQLEEFAGGEIINE